MPADCTFRVRVFHAGAFLKSAGNSYLTAYGGSFSHKQSPECTLFGVATDSGIPVITSRTVVPFHSMAEVERFGVLWQDANVTQTAKRSQGFTSMDRVLKLVMTWKIAARKTGSGKNSTMGGIQLLQCLSLHNFVAVKKKHLISDEVMLPKQHIIPGKGSA